MSRASALPERGRGRCGPERFGAPTDVRELDVAPLIADDPGRVQIEVEDARGVAHHAGFGLPAGARSTNSVDDGLRMMRAVMPGVDGRPPRGKRARARWCVSSTNVLRVQPARDTPLVGDDHNGEAGALQQANRVDAPGINATAAMPGVR